MPLVIWAHPMAGGGMCGSGLIDRSVAEIQPTAVGGSFDLPWLNDDLTYIEGSRWSRRAPGDQGASNYGIGAEDGHAGEGSVE